MNAGAPIASSSSQAQCLVDRDQVEAVLAAAVPGGQIEGHAPRHVRIERCWPGRSGDISFEWSFDLAPGTRQVLHGQLLDSVPDSPDGLRAATPVIRDGLLLNVFADLPQWRLRVHSLDRDPRLTHLASCLDGPRMARRIATLTRDAAVDLKPPPGDVVAKPISYRAGRRATLAYQSRTPGVASPWVAGKTFHNGRGLRLIESHLRINRQLAERSHGQIRTPAAAGYLPDEHMAVFCWAPGEPVTDRSRRCSEAILRAIDALAHLHHVWLPELPDFTLADECQIVTRWYEFLQRVRPVQARRVAALVEGLAQWSRRIQPGRRCTLHRDFYASQVLATRRTITVLDLDTLARGEPGVDLGNFIAHWYFDTLSGEDDSATFADLLESAAQRYEAGGGSIDRQVLGFCCASALFRIGAVHCLRTATGRYTEPLWDQAREVMAQGGGGEASPARSLNVDIH